MHLRLPQWLIKYKILHVFSWMLVAFIAMFISYDVHSSMLSQWIAYLVITAAAIPVCYYIVYTLTPRYLYQKRVGLYIIYLLLLAALNAIITYLLALVTYHLLTGLPVFPSIFYFFTLLFEMLLIDIILISISCIIKIISDRFFMEQQLLEIEKEKVSTELNFLRSQVNPHFLFNVLNTIYFQIENTNINARQSVEKLSEMLRYQLYECTTDKIQIHKELQYIENYVAIQTLRMERDFDIQLYIDHQMNDFLIAPLLILPIVENSFKHVSNFKESGKNSIHLTIKNPDNHILYIEAVNTYDQSFHQKHLLQTGGLGVQNLKRRLELLYPCKYELTIDKDENLYKTTLKLQYDD